ncbi:MAG TPA: hypothetical protein VFZ53_30935 [Polyangiaceae bacterium]
MLVSFHRTGTRRYAVIVAVTGEPARAMDPAPGYDDDIPHDLVHYVVEAELGFANGVFGSAAQGAGTFVTTAERDSSPRERARRQRKQRRRERTRRMRDERGGSEMAMSERLAAVCDVAWRRKHGQRPDPERSAPAWRTEDTTRVERVVARLDALAPLWRGLPIGEKLVFEWPNVMPKNTMELDYSVRAEAHARKTARARARTFGFYAPPRKR